MFSPVLLCVDDRPDWLKLRKSALELLGYYVVTATDAPTAITLLEALPVDVVLLEYKCDGFDAEAVAYQVKCRFPSQPIVLISAYPEIPDRTLWLVDDYLMNSQLDLLPVSIARVMHEKQKVHGGVEYSGQQRRPAGSDRPTSDRVKEIA